jgi:6-phosphogluconolactonase (cycloisomerase 2 family)
VSYQCESSEFCDQQALVAGGYSIDANSGALTTLPASPFRLQGKGARALAIDATGRHAYFVSPEDLEGNPTFNISAMTIDSTTGALTTIPGSPVKISTNPFSIAIRPDGKFLYVGDAGISVYAVDPMTGALTSVSESPGPQFSYAIAIDPQGKFAYVNDEVDLISVYSIDPITGMLASMNHEANNAPGRASVRVTPDGRFVYVMQLSGETVSGYAVDSAIGALTAVAGSPFTTGADTAALAIDPSGKYAYVATADGKITSYSIDSASGSLSPIPGAVAQAAPGGASIAIR